MICTDAVLHNVNALLLCYTYNNAGALVQYSHNIGAPGALIILVQWSYNNFSALLHQKQQYYKWSYAVLQ